MLLKAEENKKGLGTVTEYETKVLYCVKADQLLS